MIIAKIKAGLGNQLFCYAVAYALARENHTGLRLDKIGYQTAEFWPRKYQLKLFRLYEPKVVLHGGKIHHLSKAYFQTVKRAALSFHARWLRLRYHPELVAEKQNYHYEKIPVEAGKNYYLDGYWQHFRYFDAYRDDVLAQYQLKTMSAAAHALCERAKG
ncbi:MAG: hypothetical protein PHY12_03795 [Eubacteriales bacterium]|nr:hypothetical protein [Eubacteriales bacterium]